LDAVKSRDPDDYDACLLAHLKALRKNRLFEKSMIVLAVESNLGTEGHRIPKVVKKKIENVFIVSEKDRAGIWTSPAVKITMASLLQMNFQRERVYYSDSIVSAARDSTGRMMLNMFIDQLSDFSRNLVVSNKNSAMTKIRTIISGKDKGPDDMAMAFCICIYALQEWVLDHE
jgi:hypothetical protein